MDKINDDDEFTPAQAAKLMGVSDQTIRRWIEKGKLAGADTRNPFLERAPYKVTGAAIKAFAQAKKKK